MAAPTISNSEIVSGFTADSVTISDYAHPAGDDLWVLVFRSFASPESSVTAVRNSVPFASEQELPHAVATSVRASALRIAAATGGTHDIVVDLGSGGDGHIYSIVVLSVHGCASLGTIVTGSFTSNDATPTEITLAGDANTLMLCLAGTRRSPDSELTTVTATPNGTVIRSGGRGTDNGNNDRTVVFTRPGDTAVVMSVAFGGSPIATRRLMIGIPLFGDDGGEDPDLDIAILLEHYGAHVIQSDIQRNEPSAAARRIYVTILNTDGTAHDGDVTGVKAKLTQNGVLVEGVEIDSPADIVKIRAGLFYVDPGQPYTNITEFGTITAVVPAAEGRRQSIPGIGRIIPAGSATPALTDAQIAKMVYKALNYLLPGYSATKVPGGSKVLHTLPDEAGEFEAPAVFNANSPGVDSIGVET